MRGRAAAVALPRTSLTPLRTLIGLAYSQFKLIKIILKKINYNLLLFNVTDIFFFLKIASTSSTRLPNATQLPLIRHNGLLACIPGFEGTLPNTRCIGGWMGTVG
jgi:hypothetical protein